MLWLLSGVIRGFGSLSPVRQVLQVPQGPRILRALNQLPLLLAIAQGASNAASPLLGHLKIMKLRILRSADKAFHVNTLSTDQHPLRKPGRQTRSFTRVSSPATARNGGWRFA